MDCANAGPSTSATLQRPRGRPESRTSALYASRIRCLTREPLDQDSAVTLLALEPAVEDAPEGVALDGLAHDAGKLIRRDSFGLTGLAAERAFVFWIGRCRRQTELAVLRTSLSRL